MRLIEWVDDIVDLDVLLVRPGADVVAVQRVAMEAIEVALAQVDARRALDDPLRHCPPDAPGVRDPDRLGGPEAAHIGRFPEEREAVRREGEEAVEDRGEPRIAAGRGCARRRPPAMRAMCSGV